MPDRELLVASLLLTRACNLSCSYCPRDRRRRATMSSGVLRRALDVARALAGDRLIVELSGGEPLLARRRLQEAFAYLATGGRGRPRVAWRLKTNGLGLDDEAIALLAAHDVELDVSCDGPRGQAQRGDGTFAALDRTLRRIRRRRPGYWRRRIAVVAVFNPASLPYLAETAAYLLELGPPRIAIVPASGPAAAWGEAACRELERQLAAVERLAVEHRRRTGAVPFAHLRPVDDPSSEPEEQAACGAGLGRGLVIDTDGTAHGCAQLARAGTRGLEPSVARLAAALVYGNVGEPDFAARWRRLPPPGSRLPVLGSRAAWTSGERRCARCPARAGCHVCPLAGPVPGQVPDVPCLFARLAHAQRRRLTASDPLGDLLRAGGLSGGQLRRAQGWLRYDRG